MKQYKIYFTFAAREHRILQSLQYKHVGVESVFMRYMDSATITFKTAEDCLAYALQYGSKYYLRDYLLYRNWDIWSMVY